LLHFSTTSEPLEARNREAREILRRASAPAEVVMIVILRLPEARNREAVERRRTAKDLKLREVW
jgi:hypothetical protein